MSFVSSMSASDLLDMANVVASTFSVAQGVRQTRQADRLHTLERIHSERQHQRERNQSERHYNNDHSREVEHHLHDVVSEMVSSNAEADRDMWEQKNSELQMMMLSATVVFSGGFSVAVEGRLEEDASTEVELMYSIFLALGFAFLLLSILLGMILSKRISFFMYAQSKARQRNVQDIIQSGQKLVEMNYARTDHARTGRALTTAQQRGNYGVPEFLGGGYAGDGAPPSAGAQRSEGRTLRRYPSSGVGGASGQNQNPQDSKAEFQIREAMAELYTALTSVPQLSFQDYFERYARFWSQSVAHSFIFGTIALLAATAIMLWSRFVDLHDNIYAAFIFTVILGAVGIICALLLGNYFFSGISVDGCFARASRAGRMAVHGLPGSQFAKREHRLHRNLRRRVAGVGSSFTNQRNLNTLLTEEFGKMVPAAAVPLMQQVHRILRQQLELASPRHDGPPFGRVRGTVPNLRKLQKDSVIRLFKQMVRSESSARLSEAKAPGDARGVSSSISIRELRVFLEREVSKHYEWNLFQENAWILMWDVNGDGIISLDEFWRGVIRAEMLFLEEEFHNLRGLYEQIDAAVQETTEVGTRAAFADRIGEEIRTFEGRRARAAARDATADLGARKNSAGERMYTVFEWRMILNNIEAVALTDVLLATMFLWAGNEAFWLDRTEYSPNMLLHTEVNREARLSEREVKDFLAAPEDAEAKIVNTIDFLWREMKAAQCAYDRVVMDSVRMAQRSY